MRKLLAVVVFYSIGLIAKSQNLTVEGIAPDVYITHIVAPKENFYSISRFYNQSPKSIASFNQIVMEKGLSIGQQVKIPLNAQNFDSIGTSSGDQTLIPLTHIVAKSETLFKIGNDINVTAESIRKWNNLSSDNIAAGTPLVVGYLKTSDTQLPAFVAKNTIDSAINNEAPAKKSAAESDKQIPAENKKDGPFISVSPASDEQEKKQQTKAEMQDEGAQSVKDSQPVSNSTAGIAEKDTALAVIPEETLKSGKTATAPVKEEPVKQPEISLTKNEESKRIIQPNETSKPTAGTTFEDIYTVQASQKSENTKSGEAATFKSTSGWQDKKYYVLIDDVAPGTIVKISSAENKSVYAKVLGSMPEMKENVGLLVRISNAAASSLGIIDPKFPVQISYY